jgi:hypothetical protein
MQGGTRDQAQSWKPKFMWDVDLIHIHMPEISKLLTPQLEQAYAAMQVLEDVRDPCVRGDKKITKKIIRDVDRAFTTTVALCQDIVDSAAAQAKPTAAAARANNKAKRAARTLAASKSAKGRKH